MMKRKIAPEELRKILKNHKEWLVRKGRRGVKADFREARLVRAKLWGADLMGADLTEADLTEADLWEADLREAKLTGAKLWGADLMGANLTGANLRGADLWGADLREADLQEANLREVDLRKAVLGGAEDLIIEQLSKVKTLYQAKLDPELEQKIKEKCPHLLEPPKDDDESE